MPRLTRREPKYRLHKASGQGIVTLDGRDHYLGAYGTPESKAAYHELIQRWLENGRRLPGTAVAATTAPLMTDRDAGPPAPDLTINEVLVKWWHHAGTHYRTPAGVPSKEFANFRDSLRLLREDYGASLACEFGPLKLKALRRAMVERGLARTTINQRVGRIVRVFKWAASEELIPAPVHDALTKVGGLQKGRTKAREPEPVRPVSEAEVEAVRPFVPRQVWAMIELQRLTGMRPGEVVRIRTGDLDRSGKVWVYSPPDHKMAYRGEERRVFIGPAAQAILAPWLKADPDAFLFSPAEARAERFAAMRAGRKSRVQPSQVDRRKRNARRRPGTRYTTRTYYFAIRRACARAFPHPVISGIGRNDRTPEQLAELKEWDRRHSWHPHQIRHSAATRLRREFGLDASRTILGHSSPAVTAIYAEADFGKAREIMGEIG